MGLPPIQVVSEGGGTSCPEGEGKVAWPSVDTRGRGIPPIPHMCEGEYHWSCPGEWGTPGPFKGEGVPPATVPRLDLARCVALMQDLLG